MQLALLLDGVQEVTTEVCREAVVAAVCNLQFQARHMLSG